MAIGSTALLNALRWLDCSLVEFTRPNLHSRLAILFNRVKQNEISEKYEILKLKLPRTNHKDIIVEESGVCPSGE